MGLLLCKCCCCFECCSSSNSVGVATAEQRHLKVLLLGLAGSGKTEVGHTLSQQQRLHYESTNGVQYYQMQLPETQLSITEIGGNEEMKKLWHHYFATTMGIIYCFDMSASAEDLCEAFAFLRMTLTHAFLHGKPILLVGTKSDLTSDGLQLYDIENTFQLQAMAKHYASSIRLCHAGKFTNVGEKEGVGGSLGEGINWLVNYLVENCDVLKIRIKCDTNMKKWQTSVDNLVAEGRIKRGRYSRFARFSRQLTNSGRRKFLRLSHGYQRSRRIRPRTAPAAIHCISYKSNSTSTEIIMDNDEDDDEEEEEIKNKVPTQNANVIVNF